ncbi:MAG: DUF4398 domain-containing protein, partial [Spirochaetaceae bacterium]|nr:DUF4398 domain-containing protein [Spirochaetaceae bacterium]
MKREKLINCTLFGVLTAVMAMFFIACAKPPVQEMSDAQAAVARAENDPDVIAYSANTLSRAKEALNNMQTEADAKRYDAAKNFANDAQNLAEKAIADAKNAVGRQKDEAANAINVMNNALTATEDLLQGARSSGGQGLDINSLDRDFTEARTTAQEA